MVANLLSPRRIMNRLLQVDCSPQMKELFYPYLAEEGGQELVSAADIVEMLAKKIKEFQARDGYSPALEALILIHLPEYIAALTDDSEVVEEAQSLLRKILTEAITARA